MLNLIQPMYKQTAAYGHFGREGSDTAFTWEKPIKLKHLKMPQAFKLIILKARSSAGFLLFCICLKLNNSPFNIHYLKACSEY